MADDEAEAQKINAKDLREFYLAEFTALRDELAAVSLNLNTNYRFSITTSAVVVSFSISRNLEATGYAMAVSAILTFALWVKTSRQQGREGPALNYFFHISEKLSGSIPLEASPRSWEAALRDADFVVRSKVDLSVGLLDRLIRKARISVSWAALLVLQVAGAIYLVWLSRH